MKTPMKRLLASILAIAMCLSLLSASVWAAETSEADADVSVTEEVEPEEEAPEAEEEEVPAAQETVAFVLDAGGNQTAFDNLANAVANWGNGCTLVLTALLQRQGIPVFAAVSLRSSRERRQAQTVVKTARFRFHGFRAYPAWPWQL